MPTTTLSGMIEPGITAEQLAQAGVKRISIGGGLARLALGHVMKGALEMKERGTFNWLAEMIPPQELRRIFG